MRQCMMVLCKLRYGTAQIANSVGFTLQENIVSSAHLTIAPKVKDTEAGLVFGREE